MLLAAAGFVALVLFGVEGCGIGDVYARVRLQVVDARTGSPIPQAEVFIGDAYEVSDPERREELRTWTRDPAFRPDVLPFRVATTGDDGRLTLIGGTSVCRCVRRWDSLFGTVPSMLDDWDGISLWVSAPGHLPAQRLRVAHPRTVTAGASPGGGDLVEIDLGRVALEPEEP